MPIYNVQIMVCGSIGYGGVDEIRQLYSFLRSKGFSIVDHLVTKGMDYSDIKDFRDKMELCRRIVEHDLEFVKKADVLVVITTRPSYGTAIEMLIARNSGKRVILLAKEPVPTPWPINFSDDIVKNDDELIALLQIHRDQLY